MAQSEDEDLIRWTKHPGNPGIPEPRAGESERSVDNVFNPHVWVEDDMHLAILGGNVKPLDIHDTAYLFQSKDLTNWEYLHHFYIPNPQWTDSIEDCACPDFFKINNRHMLLCISHSP